MGPTLIIAGVALVALAAMVALIVYIGRGSKRNRAHTTWLAVAIAVMAFVAFTTLNLTVVNYTIPTAWLIALVVAGLTLLGLVVRMIVDLGWQPLRLLSVLALIALSSIAFGALGMSGVGSDLVQPLYKERATQIADAYGFTAYLPANLDMPTDSLPVDALPEPDEALTVQYDEFWLQERKTSEESTPADLSRLVSPGALPMGVETVPIPDGATVTSATVQGGPAVAVEYVVTPGGEIAAGATSGKSKSSRTVILVFELGGTDVRMQSEGGERESGGEFVPFEGMSIDELVAVAETLEPLE